MSLVDLTVENLRCLQRAELALHPRHNLVWGGNGSGKTSLLEAIFLLGRGRSFRTRTSERLIRYGEDQLVVFGRTDDRPPVTLGVQIARDEGTRAKVGGSFVATLTELSQAFPVQVIDPGIHKLVEEGGHGRRRWIDWAVFHVERAFVPAWIRYTKALRQRNAALKDSPDQAPVWEPQLAELGELIAGFRRAVLERLQPYWREAVTTLVGFGVDLHYTQGWVRDISLADALRASRERDINKGVTHVGPHRADVSVRIGGRLAREVLSRGQQKLVAIAMTLSQLRMLQEAGAPPPTLLLDDPAAELDGEHLARFIDQVDQLECQLVLTSLHPDVTLFGTPDQVFHVERGSVESV